MAQDPNTFDTDQHHDTQPSAETNTTRSGKRSWDTPTLRIIETGKTLGGGRVYNSDTGPGPTDWRS